MTEAKLLFTIYITLRVKQNFSPIPCLFSPFVMCNNSSSSNSDGGGGGSSSNNNNDYLSKTEDLLLQNAVRDK